MTLNVFNPSMINGIWNKLVHYEQSPKLQDVFSILQELQEFQFHILVTGDMKQRGLRDVWFQQPTSLG